MAQRGINALAERFGYGTDSTTLQGQLAEIASARGFPVGIEVVLALSDLEQAGQALAEFTGTDDPADACRGAQRVTRLLHSQPLTLREVGAQERVIAGLPRRLHGDLRGGAPGLGRRR